MARVIEFDPTYCDRIIERFETLTGKQATLSGAGQSFEAITEERSRADLSISTPEEAVQ